MAKKSLASKSSDAVAVAKSPAKKSATPKAAELSGDLIGETAGKVWHALTTGPQTVASLKKSIDAPGDLVLVSLGWLAREGKLGFETSGRSVKVSLR